MYKAPVKSSPPTPSFLQAACPRFLLLIVVTRECHSTEGEGVTFQGLVHPKESNQEGQQLDFSTGHVTLSTCRVNWKMVRKLQCYSET